MLIAHGVSAVPVVDGEGRVLGVISEADLLRKEEFKVRRGGLPAALVRPGHVRSPISSPPPGRRRSGQGVKCLAGRFARRGFEQKGKVLGCVHLGDTPGRW
ncbi:CBS domain-containing protein [Nonomuraea sp. B12E4]|uniref:CBS domain-containing protein n=1 Tax=Nonomuraea sp. B12E4 TaxID=3153564 RepID=UPI00325D38E0